MWQNQFTLGSQIREMKLFLWWVLKVKVFVKFGICQLFDRNKFYCLTQIHALPQRIKEIHKKWNASKLDCKFGMLNVTKIKKMEMEEWQCKVKEQGNRKWNEKD